MHSVSITHSVPEFPLYSSLCHQPVSSSPTPQQMSHARISSVIQTSFHFLLPLVTDCSLYVSLYLVCEKNYFKFQDIITSIWGKYIKRCQSRELGGQIRKESILWSSSVFLSIFLTIVPFNSELGSILYLSPHPSRRPTPRQCSHLYAIFIFDSIG